MNSKRKVVLFIATSLDGYIARTDGDIEWLHEVESKGDGENGYFTFYENIDTVLMGRKTYDKVLTLADQFPYPDKKNYVFSRTRSGSNENVTFINENVETFMKRLKSEDGDHIWLVGGGDLFHTFLEKNLVDELIVTIIPVLLGAGIPLLSKELPNQHLNLLKSTNYGQFVQLHYSVNEKKSD
ncbi:dihydrofolate reductase family protein [Bacillus timonensis]|nr:dihydrofolate reductase family protein [Bacillus timonensis]